jgi:hypothetical protein
VNVFKVVIFEKRELFEDGVKVFEEMFNKYREFVKIIQERIFDKILNREFIISIERVAHNIKSENKKF